MTEGSKYNGELDILKKKIENWALFDTQTRLFERVAETVTNRVFKRAGNPMIKLWFSVAFYLFKHRL